MLGLLGRKKGMTQVFDPQGNRVPVTVVEVGPCVVVQKKTVECDGYHALQLGFVPKKVSRTNKAELGHVKKQNLEPFRYLREFRLDGATDIPEGLSLTAALFKPGDMVHVTGTTKGRGFQGVIKRHGKHGGPAAHGSDFHRRPGSIGMRTQPGRVLLNTRLPGHMGVDRVTTQNLKVIAVIPEDHAVLIQGSIPGAREGLVEIITTDRKFLERLHGENTSGASAT